LAIARLRPQKFFECRRRVTSGKSSIIKGANMIRIIFGGRIFAALATLIVVTATLDERAAAQAIYTYTGNPFMLFSCGPSVPGPGTIDCSTPAPTNTNTSYTATDHVTATLTLDTPLGANFAYSDISGLPGFSLALNDGQQTIETPIGSGQFLFAFAGTDSNGNINQWRLGVNTGGFDNGGIHTFNFTDTMPHVFDDGIISCCDPSPPGDLAMNFSLPATWSLGSAPPSPAVSVNNLIGTISNPSLGLTSGQISSLTDKLNNVLASLQANQIKQASNQLSSFINSVQSSIKTQKLNAQTGNMLIAAANSIIASL
jgi:hypothetical protein